MPGTAAWWIGLLATFNGFGLLAGAKPEAVQPEIRRYALVIGYNQSSDPNDPSLQYADDDAVKQATLLSEFGIDVKLLTELDTESQALYERLPVLAPQPSILEKTFLAMNQKMQRDRQRGHQVLFYFFYAGHGHVQNYQGYVQLQGGRFSRRELIHLLRRSQASINHVMIDACNAYYMFFQRGKGGRRQRLSIALPEQDKELLDHTGFILSTSAAEKSHEWSRFQAGIFSHELRSAMRGGADLNGDGRISYQETASFLWNANQSILNEVHRPKFFVFQPRNRQLAAQGLVDMSWHRFDRLIIKTSMPRHFYIEDAKGERILDLHNQLTHPTTLRLPQRRPLFIRSADQTFEYRLQAASSVSFLDELPRFASQSIARGSEHLAFNRLFLAPYTMTSIDEYSHYLRVRLTDNPTITEAASPLQTHLGHAAMAGIGGALLLQSWSFYEKQKAQKSHLSQPDLERINQSLRRNDRYASYLFGVGMVSALAYVGYPLFDTESEVVIYPNLFGASLQIGVRF